MTYFQVDRLMCSRIDEDWSDRLIGGVILIGHLLRSCTDLTTHLHFT